MNKLRATYPLGYELPKDGSLSPQYVIERLSAITGPDAIYVAGVGHMQEESHRLEVQTSHRRRQTPKIARVN